MNPSDQPKSNFGWIYAGIVIALLIFGFIGLQTFIASEDKQRNECFHQEVFPSYSSALEPGYAQALKSCTDRHPYFNWIRWVVGK